MSNVLFHSADRKFTFNGKNRLKEFIGSIFKMESKAFKRIDYVFCSDSYLLEINLNFLKHDDYTDIITFDLSSSPEIEGEIYISIDRVKENAVSHKRPFTEELLRVVFHGILHLCGYGDKKKSEITLMRSKEEYYLRLFEEKLNES